MARTSTVRTATSVVADRSVLTAAVWVTASSLTVAVLIVAATTGYVVDRSPDSVTDRTWWWMAGLVASWWLRWTWLTVVAVGAAAARARPSRPSARQLVDAVRPVWGSLARLAAGWALWVRLVRWLVDRTGNRWWVGWLGRAARSVAAVTATLMVPQLLAADDRRLGEASRQVRRRVRGRRLTFVVAAAAATAQLVTVVAALTAGWLWLAAPTAGPAAAALAVAATASVLVAATASGAAGWVTVADRQA